MAMLTDKQIAVIAAEHTLSLLLEEILNMAEGRARGWVDSNVLDTDEVLTLITAKMSNLSRAREMLAAQAEKGES